MHRAEIREQQEVTQESEEDLERALEKVNRQTGAAMKEANREVSNSLEDRATSGVAVTTGQDMWRNYSPYFHKESEVKNTRLTQKLLKGDPVTARCCETRIWQKLDGNWKQVHVHRS